MAQLYYQGHGSFRITTDEGKVVYVDPYAGDGYDVPADLILVTHDHMDHNQVELVANRNEGCRVITHEDALVDGKYRVFGLGWITVTPVRAENQNHDPKHCVGYILKFDDISLYASGDTSYFREMFGFRPFKLDWALFPTDGMFNMGPEEATRCAEECGTKKAIPIHCKPGVLYDEEVAQRFTFEGRVLVRPGETIDLHAEN